jgi:predicted DNA-binding WGR domain protein
MDNRYYVLRLTKYLYHIRERREGRKPLPGDRTVQQFQKREDALAYALRVNEKQRKLDAEYGHWRQSAV